MLILSMFCCFMAYNEYILNHYSRQRPISHYKADDTKLHEQERDILKAWIDGGIQIALIGLEHQTEPEKQMAD